MRIWVLAVILLGCGPSVKSTAPPSPAAAPAARLDEQPPVRLVYCVAAGAMSAADAKAAIEVRIPELANEEASVTKLGETIVVKLPAEGETDGEAIAEADLVSALRRGGELPRLVPCPP